MTNLRLLFLRVLLGKGKMPRARSVKKKGKELRQLPRPTFAQKRRLGNRNSPENPNSEKRAESSDGRGAVTGVRGSTLWPPIAPTL